MEDTAYILENISLIESFFKRETHISYDSENFETQINIRTGYNINDNKLFVQVSVEFSAQNLEKKEIDIKVTILGIFIIPKNSELSLESFAKINAPAIIFPFIREHIASLSLKAGLQPILLPPINFVKLAKKK